MWAYRHPGQSRPDPQRATHVYRETALLVRELVDTRAKLKALVEQQEAARNQFQKLVAREAAAMTQLKLQTEGAATAHSALDAAIVREERLERELMKARNERAELALQLRAAESVAGRAERARADLAERIEELRDEPVEVKEKLAEAIRRAQAAEWRAEILAQQLSAEQARFHAQAARAAVPVQTQPSPSEALQKALAELRASKDHISLLEAELKRAQTAAMRAAHPPLQAPPPSVAPLASRRRGKTPLSEQESLRRENDQLRAELAQARQAGAEASANLRELQKRIAAVETTLPRPQKAQPPPRWRVPGTEEDPDLRRRIDAALQAGYEPDQDRIVKTLVSVYRTEHELARWQQEHGLPVTAQRIRPGTDLMMVAFCEAMQLRSDYPLTLRPSQYRKHIDRTNWPFHLDVQAELELWQATIHRRVALDIAMGKED